MFLVLWKQIKSCHIYCTWTCSSPYAPTCDILIVFADWRIFHNIHICTWDLRASACAKCMELSVRIPFYRFRSTTWNFRCEVPDASLSCRYWKMTFHTFHIHTIYCYCFCSLFSWFAAKYLKGNENLKTDQNYLWSLIKWMFEQDKHVSHLKSLEEFSGSNERPTNRPYPSRRRSNSANSTYTR